MINQNTPIGDYLKDMKIGEALDFAPGMRNSVTVRVSQLRKELGWDWAVKTVNERGIRKSIKVIRIS